MMSSSQSLTLIYESRNSLIYYQPAGEHDLVIKVLTTNSPTSQQLIHFNNEYEFTRDLVMVNGVRKVITQTRIEDKLALVLEYITGQTLHQAFVEQRQSLIDILQAVIQIAQILGEVHQHQIIHKNINSHNILINLETKQVKLIDFGLASRIDLQVQHLGNPEGLEETLAYISPEQTGRMNRIVDYRTDLYSLGVTFYEMLTGQLPFRSDDPLALVHAHIAKTPQSVTALNPAVPPILADIVMKLLAKNAEDRYQSAFGLKADLERWLAVLTDLKGFENLSGLNFELGQEDYSGQLHIPQKLYGRTTEIATLVEAFERVAAGSQELMLVAGYAGVGKSALVAEVHKPITEKRGYFISGKFDQYHQNIPYTAFTHAFNQLAEFLLTESDTTLQEWRDMILDAVGSNGAVLTEVMPSLEKVIGPQPAVVKLGGYENRNRFNLTFQNFVQAISTAEHPLVVFIDDWQWADLSSLELLKVLLTGEKISHLLLIGAYRDNEVDQTHPFMMTLNDLTAASITMQTIELGNLQLADVGRLIQESLAGSRSGSQDLTDLVYEKTQGNAFFTRQFLQNLYVEGWLEFDFTTRRWIWDIVQINAQQITANVVDLMARKLSRLAPETANLLQLAACIGNEFDLQTLTLIGQTDASTALELLSEILSEGFVIPLDNYYKLSDTASQARFSFLHDRVQQAAYAQISAPERQNMHLEIGRLLLANTPKTELNQRVFEIVQHYNQASVLITTATERLRVAELNMHAADLAYGAAAFRSAQIYLETAMSLMPPDAWSNRYNVMVNLHSLLATVLSLTGDIEQLERIYQIVEKQAHTMSDSARVKKAKIQSLLYHGNYTDAIELGLSFIRGMGIPVNRDPLLEEAFKCVQEIDDWLTQDRIESISRLPEAGVDVGHIVEVAITINGPMYNSKMPLFLVFISQIMKLSIEQGLTPWSPVTIINFAMGLAAVMHNIPKARFITDTTMKLLEERPDADILVSTLNLLFGGFILHRYDHLKNTLPVFIEGVQKGLTTGTFQFAGYCAWWQVWHLLFTGEPLSQVEAISRQAEETCEKMQMGRMKDWCLLIHQVTLNLQGKSEAPCILTGSVYDEQEKQAYSQQVHDSADVFRFFLYKGWLHYLFQEPRASVTLFRDAESYILYGTGTYFVPLFHFYDTLANAAFFDLCAPEEHPEILERIQHNLKEFEVWVRFAPMNHQHKQDLMNAEKARIEGRDWEALTFYEKAIQGASEHEFLHEEALAYERAAEFYLSRRLEEIARLYMTRAYDSYSRWQAWAKVQDLEQRYRDWLAKPAHISSKESPAEYEEGWRSLDLKSVMKASQAISRQIVLEELLRKLMEIVIENAGAQRGCLILEKDGKWVIEAEGTADLKDVLTLQAIEIEESDAVCLSIVRYVARSHESIVLDDAVQKGLFVDDPYVKQNQTKSILCTPLLNRGRLSGILYLENNLAADTFTPKRIEVLELLAGQAAIALENAVLYQQAQQEIAERKLAEAALRESEQRFRTIFDSVNDAIFVHDLTTGDILDVNAKMCTMYGYTREEALQIKIEDLNSGGPSYTQKDALTWMKKASEGEPQLFEWRAKDKEGRLFWVEVNMHRAVIGGQDRLLVVVHDITERKRVEEALRENESRYRAIIESQVDLISRYLPDTTLTFVNDAYCQFYGKTREELIGHSYLFMIAPEFRELVRKETEDLSKAPRPLAGEYLNYRYDGKKCWIQWVVQCIRDKNGQVVELQAVGRDITERKSAEEALKAKTEELDRYFTSSLDLLCIADTDGYFHRLNPEWETTLGYTIAELEGRQFLELVHPEDVEATVAAISQLETQKQVLNFENRYRCKDGSYRWIEWRSYPIGKMIYAVARDITERKRVEEALQKAHDDLEKQVEERTAELRVANAELARASHLKDEFLANMSHELRSPLNTILGFSDLLRREALAGRQTLSPIQQDHLSLIHRSGDHLLTLINNVLDLSKIEAGRTTLTAVNFDLHYLLIDLEDMFALRAEDKQLTLQVEYSHDLPRYVRTDEVKLRQVLINLLSNALKFTEEGGVMVRVGTVREPPLRVLFEIEDTGPGIAPEELGTLFEAFTQTATGQVVHEGTGLGLAISRQFVQLIGGEISVQSDVGQGSVFQFTIPVEVVEATVVPSKPLARRIIGLVPGQPRYRILIVDDNEHNRQLLFNILHPLGFELQAATNGQEAIDIWQQWQPHLIWMDLRMPVLNGYEATKQIRAMSQEQPTKILIMTASSFEEERAVAAGCDDFLRKPFRETDLLEMMGRHLGVCYVYEEAVKEQQEGLHKHIDIQELTSKLATLPAELLTRLEAAAIRAKMNEMNELIEAVRAHDATIAEALAILADNFEYPRIVALIQASKQRSTEE